jgi:hypothetical protein
MFQNEAFHNMHASRKIDIFVKSFWAGLTKLSEKQENEDKEEFWGLGVKLRILLKWLLKMTLEV